MMPLTAAGLKAALVNELSGASYDSRGDAPEGSGFLSADRDEALEKLAAAVIDYFKANAVVTGQCPPAPPAGR